MPENQINGKPRSLLNTIHLIVTILIAVLGGVISWMQFEFSQEQQQFSQEQERLANLLEKQQHELESRKTITDQSVELLKKAKEYIDILHLDDDKKKLVLISLLQLEKDLRISKTGELSDEQILDKVNALPHHVALLAGASETLAHIGGTQTDLKLWIPIAKTSGDIKVRRAAIDALRNVGLLTDDTATLETCVESIIELTRRWNVSELRVQAAEAITAIANAYRHGEIDEATKVNTMLSDALRELEGTLLAQAVASPLTSSEAAPGSDTTDGQPDRADVPEVTPEQEAPSKESQDLASVRQLRQYYEPTSKEDLEDQSIQPLITKLQSDSTKERRLARSRISDYGDQAIPQLIDILARNSEDYRIKVGVVTALLLMEQPVSLVKVNDLSPLITLLGDTDATVRKNTAVFLGNLTDREAIETVRQKLEDLSTSKENLENGNLIYNSVIVLGDWLKYNTAIDDNLRSNIKQSIQVVDKHLDQDTSRSWSSTKSKISEYLKFRPNA
jgi:HEAT repeat protein